MDGWRRITGKKRDEDKPAIIEKRIQKASEVVRGCRD